MIASTAMLLSATAYELGLFAAAIFAVFGIDDLLVDVLFLSGIEKRLSVSDSTAAPADRDFALFIPAWSEGDVIGAMLAHTAAAWPTTRLSIYVGVYPNDLATLLAVSQWVARDARVRMVIRDQPGPTTKGDCLNQLWQQHLADVAALRVPGGAVVLHDAEDMVDPAALALFDQALVDADYAQIPVVPLMASGAYWVSRHYADEFAEAHGKEMVVRAAIGAPLPTAGVGCAFRLETLAAISAKEGPFPADSLTEDYELGLRLAAAGARARFVRAHADDGRLIASRAYFPHEMTDAVRQKTRWLRGNALEAWGRIGWVHPPTAGWLRRIASWWMLWRDRRAVIAAAAVLTGYIAMLLAMVALALSAWTGAPLPIGSAAVVTLAECNLILLLWRLAMRGWFTGRLYGVAHGAMAPLRQPVSNFILVATAWRAMLAHWHGLRGQAVVWDKTNHVFPHSVSLSDKPPQPPTPSQP